MCQVTICTFYFFEIPLQYEDLMRCSIISGKNETHIFGAWIGIGTSRRKSRAFQSLGDTETDVPNRHLSKTENVKGVPPLPRKLCMKYVELDKEERNWLFNKCFGLKKKR